MGWPSLLIEHILWRILVHCLTAQDIYKYFGSGIKHIVLGVLCWRKDNLLAFWTFRQSGNHSAHITLAFKSQWRQYSIDGHF